MSRTREAIQQDYTQLCAQLGNLVYQNDAMTRNIERNEQEVQKTQQKMRKLALEADELDKANAASQAAPQTSAATEQKAPDATN